MVMFVDVWFWSVSLSILAAVEPFSAGKPRMNRLVRQFGLLSALISLGVSLFEIGNRFGGALVLISLWQILNILRFFKRRHRIEEINRRIKATSYWMVIFVGLAIVIYAIEGFWIDGDHGERALIALLSLSFMVSIGLMVSAVVNMSKFRRTEAPGLSVEAPSVTLAIPARNETHSLRRALDSAMESDYPKLEILVLDDCSHDNTSQIIKDLAQKGVRFVQGVEPSNGWLGKNSAYKLLSEQASGEYIVFSSADVHHSPGSVSSLIAYMEHQNIDMVSVMPRRREFDVLASLFQPIRYVLQFAWPKQLFGSQPVLSSCWIIKRDRLEQTRGFKSMKGEITPEQHLANVCAAEGKYRFIISGRKHPVTTRKRLSSQIDTATRTIYPALKQEFGFVLASILATLLILLLPFAVLALSMIGDSEIPGQDLALISAAMLSITNLLFTIKTNPKNLVVSIFNPVIVIVMQTGLVIWSAVQYEFGEVSWKGRSVCLPVLESKVPK